MAKTPDPERLELLQGTLDMLILKAVSLGALHGYGILLRIHQISKDRLEIQQGSLYPALYRLEHQGLIQSAWGESENRRKAKYYSLTAADRSKLSFLAEVVIEDAEAAKLPSGVPLDVTLELESP